VVLIDDAGFGSSSAFGGPCSTPNAERLAAAATPADRALVGAQIEDAAAAQAETIRRSNAYAAPLESSAARDAYCTVHHG